MKSVSLFFEKKETNCTCTNSVHEWWLEMAAIRGVSRKGLKSLVILVCWEIWNEGNACIFNSIEAPSFTVAEKIKGEASA